MRLNEQLVDAAVVATADMLKFSQPADAVLSTHFKIDRTGARERAFIAEAAYAVIRHRRRLARLVGSESPRRLLLAALVRFQGVSQRQLAEVVSPKEAEWLAQIKAMAEPQLSLAELIDFPDWLVERLSAHFSEAELLALAQGLNQPAPLDLMREKLSEGLAAVENRTLAGNQDFEALGKKLEALSQFVCP